MSIELNYCLNTSGASFSISHMNQHSYMFSLLFYLLTSFLGYGCVFTAVHGLFLVAESRHYSPAAVLGLLTAAASLLQRTGS